MSSGGVLHDFSHAMRHACASAASGLRFGERIAAPAVRNRFDH
jgi:hypothetical protein